MNVTSGTNYEPWQLDEPTALGAVQRHFARELEIREMSLGANKATRLHESMNRVTYLVNQIIKVTLLHLSLSIDHGP